MSGTVVRNVVIRTSIESDRTRQESGSAGGALGRSGASVQDLRRVQDEAKRAEESHVRFGRESARATLHALHGFTNLARGIALMTGSGEENIEKLARKMVYLEGVVSTVKGGMKLAQFASEFGALGVAVGVVSAAAAAAAVIWNDYTATIERAKEQVKELREEGRRLRMEENERRAAQHESDKGANIGLEGQLSAGSSETQGRKNIKELTADAAASGDSAEIFRRVAVEARTKAAKAEGKATDLPSSYLDYLRRQGSSAWGHGMKTYGELKEERNKSLEEQRSLLESVEEFGVEAVHSQQSRVNSLEGARDAQMRQRDRTLRAIDEGGSALASATQYKPSGQVDYMFAPQSMWGGYGQYIESGGAPWERAKREQEVKNINEQGAAFQRQLAGNAGLMGGMAGIGGILGVASAGTQFQTAEGAEKTAKSAADVLNMEINQYLQKSIEVIQDAKKELDKLKADVTEVRTALGKEGK